MTVEERLKHLEDVTGDLQRSSKLHELVLKGDDERDKPGIIEIQRRLLEDVYDKTMGLSPRMRSLESWQIEVKATVGAGTKLAQIFWSIGTSAAVVGLLKLVFKI